MGVCKHFLVGLSKYSSICAQFMFVNYPYYTHRGENNENILCWTYLELEFGGSLSPSGIQGRNPQTFF